MPYKIESGIPKPSFDRVKMHFPLDRMEVGDSFAVPADECNIARAAISNYQGRRYTAGRPVSFSLLKVDGGYRLWRNKDKV